MALAPPRLQPHLVSSLGQLQCLSFFLLYFFLLQTKLKPLLDNLELQFRNRQKEGTVPSDAELKARLHELQSERTGRQ